MYVCMNECIFVCMCMYMYVCVCMYVCMHVKMRCSGNIVLSINPLEFTSTVLVFWVEALPRLWSDKHLTDWHLVNSIWKSTCEQIELVTVDQMIVGQTWFQPNIYRSNACLTNVSVKYILAKCLLVKCLLADCLLDKCLLNIYLLAKYLLF